MGKITREEFSKSRPVLKPDDLNGATHVIGTVEEAERVTIDKQELIVLRFEEFPERNYFPNVTSIGRLIEGISDETDDWAGKRVPLEVVETNNPSTGKPVRALWVSAAEDWKTLIRTGKKAAAKPAKSAKKTTRK